jgi:hypothetical protein
MKFSRPIAILAGTIALAAIFASLRPLRVQAGSLRPNPLDATFARLRALEGKLRKSAILGGGAQGLFHLANNWDKLKARSANLHHASPQLSSASQLPPGQITAPPSTGPTAINPSLFRGFLMNGSTTAWCGNNAVVVYNDMESESDSFFSTTTSDRESDLGYSVSANRGATFTDMGFVPLPTEPAILGLDPDVTCTSAKNFYILSLYNSVTQNAVAVSTSTDGGQTFGPPQVASGASNTGHFFDADWIAANPANPNQLFISFVNAEFTFGVCPGGLGFSIEVVNSNDAGNTWSSPVTVADEVCLDDASPIKGVVNIPKIAVDPRGTEVYVTWEKFGVGSLDREVDISHATIPSTPSPIPLALSFSSPAKVSSMFFAGTLDGPTFGSANGQTMVQLLPGRIMTLERPQLAIGKGPQNKGVLYVTWTGGANAIPDGHTDFYVFTDILVTSSRDGGNTWTTPARVNNNPGDGTTHPFTDQFHPAIATDRTGAIAICFYDRRNDPLSFLIGRYCAVSFNGKNWANFPIDPKGGPSVVNQDDFALPDWQGDYETLAADGLGIIPGFLGGYTDSSAGYQNIRRNRF